MAIGALIKTLVKAGAYYGIAEILLRGEKSRKRLAKMALLIIPGVSLLYIAILAYIGALFFFLADATEFAKAAFITGSVILIIAILLLTEVYRLIGRK